MRWARALVLAAGLVATSGGPAGAQTITLDALIRDPVRYDHRTVIVTGVVGLVEGAQGFTLIDAGVAIRVVTAGGVSPRPGDRVEVEGIFRVGANQIEAFRVRFR